MSMTFHLHRRPDPLNQRCEPAEPYAGMRRGIVERDVLVPTQRQQRPRCVLLRGVQTILLRETFQAGRDRHLPVNPRHRAFLLALNVLVGKRLTLGQPLGQPVALGARARVDDPRQRAGLAERHGDPAVHRLLVGARHDRERQVRPVEARGDPHRLAQPEPLHDVRRPVALGRDLREPLGRRHLHVDREPVREAGGALDLLPRGAGEQLDVDVALVVVVLAQQLDAVQHAAGGRPGIAVHPGGDEQALGGAARSALVQDRNDLLRPVRQRRHHGGGGEQDVQHDHDLARQAHGVELLLLGEHVQLVGEVDARSQN